MPLKTCPECQNRCGPRSSICPDCSFEFFKKKKEVSISKTKASEPQKRKKKSNKPIKKRKKKAPIENWRTLAPGDIIKIPPNQGSYFPTERDFTKIDEKGRIEFKEQKLNLDMSHHGTFEVIRLEKDGIIAVSVIGDKSTGFCFLYMGPEKIGITGVIYKPHKVFLWKKQEQQEQQDTEINSEEKNTKTLDMLLTQ